MLSGGWRDRIGCTSLARGIGFVSSSLAGDGVALRPDHRRRPNGERAAVGTARRSYCPFREAERGSSFRVETEALPRGGGGGAVVSEELCLRLLSECNRSGEFKRGVSIHSPMTKLGLLDNPLLNNTLLSVYCKVSCGEMEARKLFDELRLRDVVSWTTMMSAQVKAGREEEALDLFHDMVSTGSAVPNEFTLSCVLRCCSSLGRSLPGLRTHAQILKQGFQCNRVLLSSLVDFYGKLEMVEEALKVFAEVGEGDAVSWTIMISGLLQAGEWARALQLFSFMVVQGINPNEFTFARLLSASAHLGPRFGESLHSRLISSGVELSLVLKTALVDMYSKWGRMGDALKVFEQTPEADVTLWTALISGYVQDSDIERAVGKFCQMEAAGIPPASFTYAGVLSACSTLPTPELGLQLHSRVIKAGLDPDASVGNALMDMYTKCFSSLKEPVLLFSAIKLPNVVSWTVLITALVLYHQLEEALSALVEMQLAQVQPNSFTLTAVLKGCELARSLVQVRKLHAYILKIQCRGLYDLSLWNSLLDAHTRLGEAEDSWKIFNEMPRRDEITYTSLAAGLNKMGLHEETLGLLPRMREEELKMDCFSLPCFLSASAGMAAIEAGRQLHCYAVRSGLDSQISVVNGLVDLYGKCGDATEAGAVFRSIPEPNIVSWNGLISALASNGWFSDALSAFESMKLSGSQPDGITFLLVLYACSHSGLADLGLDYFSAMRELHGIPPELDHYVCLVDLLGRAGRLEEAAALIQEMPFQPDALIYKTLLGACKLRRSLLLGEAAARRALELNPEDPAIYVLLSRMYDDAGKPELAEEMRRAMRNRGMKKELGQSWVEIRNRVYRFTARDGSNPHMERVHLMVDDLERRMAPPPPAASGRHSEKLAVAFGLLNTPSGPPIRVIKNLRICVDCHEFMQLASAVTSREIVVRDGSRFHSFRNGVCSCGGFW
ncbi:unnamed protein product [Spirodela intermedia]|uniref:DYW domain-containing protein n=1 Tax=Spirodela intermedia TaxID=51605 RepID=A0A7I8JXI1_SPIIN|nr:unnamed protein product [Spirodela intermedia]